MENSHLSLIKPEERTLDGNLKPEVRERVLKDLTAYLRQTGLLNVSEISQLLGLSRQTTRKLVDEIFRVWSDESRNLYMAQNQWYQATLQEIEEHPETFSKEKIQLIKLKSSLLSKINTLRKGIIIKK